MQACPILAPGSLSWGGWVSGCTVETERDREPGRDTDYLWNEDRC